MGTKITTKKNKSLQTKKTSSYIVVKSKQKDLLIGCHASISPSILDGLQYATSIGATAAQIFLGSNRQASLKAKSHITPSDIKEINTYLRQSRLRLIIHSIYLLNLCKAPPTSGRVKWMHENILHDLEYGSKLGATCVVVHLGSRLDMPIQEALDNLTENINYILSQAPRGIQLSLETAAGAGSQVGYTLEELAVIWRGVRHHGAARIGICIDTAHIFVAGEDISTPTGIRDYLRRFDREIGCQYITNFHINDSRYPKGSRHDEHKGIGQGQIFNTPTGLAALRTITQFARRHRIPLILETHSAASPTSEGTHKRAHGYEYEIAMIKKL